MTGFRPKGVLPLAGLVLVLAGCPQQAPAPQPPVAEAPPADAEPPPASSPEEAPPVESAPAVESSPAPAEEPQAGGGDLDLFDRVAGGVGIDEVDSEVGEPTKDNPDSARAPKAEEPLRAPPRAKRQSNKPIMATISRGKQVNIAKHLSRRGFTIVEFGAKW